VLYIQVLKLKVGTEVGVNALVTGEVMIKLFGTAVAIRGESNQGLEEKQSEKVRVASELAVETGLG